MSPECSKFLRFLFGKVMQTGPSSTILDRFGEENVMEDEPDKKDNVRKV
jgi:hypothetical protein